MEKCIWAIGLFLVGSGPAVSASGVPPAGNPGSKDPEILLAVAAGEFEDFEEINIEALLSAEVTTASRMARSVQEAPSIITVFTRDEIQRMGVVRLIDLLKLTPGFAEVSAPMERNLVSRGVHSATSQNVTVLIDGTRMNDFLTNSAAPDWFLLDMAEKVEIIRGPGAVLYGANALAGVVNIITRDASQGPAFTGRVAGGINDSLHLVLQNIERFEDGSHLFLSASLLQSRGTEVKIGGEEDVLLPRLGQNTSDGMQDGENLNSPYQQTPVRVNHYGPSFEGFIKYQRPDSWTLRANLASRQFHPQRTEVQSLVDPVHQSQRPTRTDTRATVDISRSWGNSDDWGEIMLRPVVQYYSHENTSQRIGEDFYQAAGEEGRRSILSWSGEELRFGLGLEYARDFGDLGLIKDFSLTAGARFQYEVAYNYNLSYCVPDLDNLYEPGPYDEDDFGHDYVCFGGAAMLDEGTVVDKWGNRIHSGKDHLGSGDDLQVGSFVQLHAKLPWDIGITLGGRVDFNPDYDPVFTPQVAVVYPFLSSFYLKGMYSSAFVYPPFLYRTDNRQAGFVGNPDMIPQGIHTGELLAGYKDSNLVVELNGFFNMLTDFITQLADGDVSVARAHYFDNAGDLQIAGLEGTVKGVLWEGRLIGSLSGGFTRILDKDAGAEAWAPSFPPYFASFILNLVPWSPLNINVSVLYLAESDFRLSDNIGFELVRGMNGRLFSSVGPGGYDTSLLTFNANVIFRFLDNWQATFTVTNIFDSVRRMAGATLVPYATEGRQIMLGVNYQH